MIKSPSEQNENALEPARRFDRRNFNWQETLGLLGMFLLLAIALSILSPYFLSINNFFNILIDVSIIGMIAVVSTMVIVAGGIDLSVGSVAALAGVAVAQLSHVMSLPLATLVALLVGMLIGLINGFAITYLNINALITTLGMLSIASGLAFVFSGGLTQNILDPTFGFLGQGYLLGIPFQVIVMTILFLIVAWVMRATVFGRTVYAIGGNSQAARLAGIPVRRYQMTIYILSGLSAALGGIFLTSELSAAAPSAASGLELSVVAAVILGGASLTGGKGTIWGTLLGVLILGTLDNGLTLLNVSSYYQDVARGSVLLLAVGLDQLRLWLLKRR